MRSIPLGRGVTAAVLLLLMSSLPWGASERSRIAAGQVLESASEDYGLAVTSADQNFVPGDSSSQPPAGRKWVVVSASLQNLQGSTVVVEAGALTLIDAQGQSYTAAPPSEITQPSLVGTTLAQGDWIRGLALFEVPVDAVAARLEWCPAGSAACAAPLSSSIPQTPSGR
jgi:hypothetical protein